MCSCLNSKEDQVVKLTLETLSIFSSLTSSQNGVLNGKNKNSDGGLKVSEITVNLGKRGN